MLSLFTGTPGSGKSYHATERIDRCLKQGINVICTYPIKTNYKHRGLFVYVPYYELTPEFLINFCMQHHDLKCNPEKCQTFIVIDEAHLLFNTRGFDMKERQKWCEFLALHRHYWYDIMLLTQNDRAIDRQVRGLVEFNYKHRKLTSYGLKGFLLVAVLHKKYVAVRYWYVLNEKCDAYFFNTKKKIFKLYDTMAIISPQKKIMTVHLPLLISFRPRLNGTPSERKKVNKVLDNFSVPCSTELAAVILKRKFKVCKDWQDGLRALKSIYAMNIQRDIAEEAKLRLYFMYKAKFPNSPAFAILKAAQIVENNIVSRSEKKI